MLCVGTLSRCTVGFDFENLGSIEFFVIRVGLRDTASLFLIEDCSVVQVFIKVSMI